MTEDSSALQTGLPQRRCTTIDIELATTDDIAGILDLQERNMPGRGGTLSVAFLRSWFEKAIVDTPLVVARRHDRVVGYTLSSSLMAQAHVAIVQDMLRVNPVRGDPYLYGPVCVAQSERGCGLASRLFNLLTARLPGREAITFIRLDNVASLKAHAKMGMRKGPEFAHLGVKYIMMSYGP